MKPKPAHLGAKLGMPEPCYDTEVQVRNTHARRNKKSSHK